MHGTRIVVDGALIMRAIRSIIIRAASAINNEKEINKLKQLRGIHFRKAVGVAMKSIA
jgi:hypothetical protein